MAADGLYLGKDLDGEGRITLDPDHLTTHAVCLGMTGSGKTGLGVVALEELARRRVPLLVVDIKGDMVDLLLNFPELEPRQLEPWLPVDLARGRSRLEVAREQADLWRGGLEASGLGPEDMRAVRGGLSWQLVTPGVGSAAPLDILPALSAPEGWDLEADLDGARDRVNSVAGAVLSLVGRGGDPLTDRDHVLLSSIMLSHWTRGEPLDLQRLLASIADPPMEALGALPLETFYPRADRMKLVLALNTLLASPAFAAWTEGAPLSMESLLGSPERPRGTIVSVAHLEDRQRLFILSLIVSELVSWMRRQPASSSLRALLYVDEVHGILPPHPADPVTKRPLLTLLKLGRAFGVGAWLATQNPVDLDYKALGNAGVKLIGRLITERDRERALEGLDLRALEGGSGVEGAVASLGKREFLLHDVRAAPRTRRLASRWAMSYLRGPVSLPEMASLLDQAAPQGPEAPASAPAARAAAAPPSGETPPVLGTAIPVRFRAGAAGSVVPSLLARCRVTVERSGLNLFRTEEELWHLPVDEEGRILWDEAVDLGAEPPDLSDRPSPASRFPIAAPSALSSELDGVERAFVRWRARRPLRVLANPRLKMAAQPGESHEQFLGRCLEAADRADDPEQQRLRDRFERRIDAVKRRLDRERDELERDREQLASRKAEEKLGMVEGLFSVLLGSRSLRSAAGKATSRVRTAATKRRMRQSAEASVTESEHEVARLTDQIEELAVEMQEQIDRVAETSEEVARAIEEVSVRVAQTGVAVASVELVWG